MRRRPILAAYALSTALAAAVAYQSGCASRGNADVSSSPSHPALGARFEAASVLVPAGSDCTLHAAGTPATPEDLRFSADEDGVARFYAARPQTPGDLDALSLDCIEPSGTSRTHLVDLRASETFAPRPFDASKTTLELRPGLEGDPRRFSREELIARGYGLRPDPASNPSGYARWLAAARVPAHKLRSAPPRASRSSHGAGPTPSVATAVRAEAGAAAPLDAGIGSNSGNPWTGALLTGSFVPNKSNPSLTTSYLANEATFVVPGMTVNAITTNNTATTIWNGLDNVFQAIVDVNTGPNSAAVRYGIHRQIFAPTLNGTAGTLNQQGVDFTPAANDTIFDEEWYCDASGNPNLTGGYACSSMTDQTQNVVWDCSKATGSSCAPFQIGTATVSKESSLGQWAEFVIENDTVQASPNNNTFWPDFAPTTMTGSALVVPGNGAGYSLSGGINEVWATTTTDPSVTVMYDWTPPADPSHVTVSLSGSEGVSWKVAPTIPSCTFGTGGTPTGPGGTLIPDASFTTASASTTCASGFDYAPGLPVQEEIYTVNCPTSSGFTVSALISGTWTPLPNACSNGAQPGQCGSATIPNQFVAGWQYQGVTQSGLGIKKSEIIMVCDGAGQCSAPFSLTASDCLTPVSTFSISPNPLYSPAGGPGPNGTITWTNAPTSPANFYYTVNNQQSGISASVQVYNGVPYFAFIANGPTQPETLNYTVTATWSGLTFTAPVTVEVTQCIAQSPSVACEGRTCGPYTDDCGNPVNCGSCSGSKPYCVYGQCEACAERTCPPNEHWNPTTCACVGCPCGEIILDGHTICAVCK